MCGVCGELNFSGRDINPLNIENMANAIIHRGPDDSGIYCGGFIGLGHRRLSIIDLSQNGRQPIWDNDMHLCLVFNGEVYNYKEIKEELLLNGYHFSSSTDSEVVVNAIHCWGIDKALSKFIGMFAFALWNSRERMLFLVRDRAGIKPLYYYITKEMLIFGSEIKAIAAHNGFRKRLNEDGLRQYFVFGHFPGDITVFRDTFKLLPGHYMEINISGAVKLKKYWSLDGISRNTFQGDFEDAANEIEGIFKDAFRYRLVSDVPVGLFLSGGIDSSLVSSILKKEINADILNITIGFHEDGYNEADKAEKVSKQLGINHVVHYMTAKEAQNALLKFCEIYDEPFGDTSGIPTYIMAKIARNYVKVALSADGGDEQFCGYDQYISYLKTYCFIKKIPYFARHTMSNILKKLIRCNAILPQNLIAKNRFLIRPQFVARYEKMVEILKIRSVGGLINLMNSMAWTQGDIDDFLPIEKGKRLKDSLPSNISLINGSDEIVDKMMRHGFSSSLPNDILTKVDRASMSVSLECRDPFLDHRITEFAYSLPIDYLYYNGEQKRILKRILRKWLDESIITAPKRGFVIPLYYWLRGAWKPIVLEYLSKERIRSIGFLDEDRVEIEINRFYKYQGCRAEKIWTMLNFQMWAERWYKD